jgi:hypothetical protein
MPAGRVRVRLEQPSHELGSLLETPLLGRSYILVRELSLDLLKHPWSRNRVPRRCSPSQQRRDGHDRSQRAKRGPQRDPPNLGAGRRAGVTKFGTQWPQCQ